MLNTYDIVVVMLSGYQIIVQDFRLSYSLSSKKMLQEFLRIINWISSNLQSKFYQDWIFFLRNMLRPVIATILFVAIYYTNGSHYDIGKLLFAGRYQNYCLENYRNIEMIDTI